MKEDIQKFPIHEEFYRLLHGEDAVYHPHTDNTSWTTEEVEDTIINGLKAGEITVKMPEMRCLRGAINSMPEIYRDEQDNRDAMTEQLKDNKTRKDAIKIFTKVRYQPHQQHIDQFEDVILWMFLIPEKNRHLFHAIISQKMDGRRHIGGDEIKDKFYSHRARTPAEKIRYDYNNILKDLCRSLNYLNYPKRNQYQAAG